MNYFDNLLQTIKKLEPIIALLILSLLIVVAIYLPQQIEINKQIRNSCGWENEQVRCICEKKTVIGYNDFNLNINNPEENVSLVR